MDQRGRLAVADQCIVLDAQRPQPARWSRGPAGARPGSTIGQRAGAPQGSRKPRRASRCDGLPRPVRGSAGRAGKIAVRRVGMPK
jgi:hypothetical protein